MDEICLITSHLECDKLTRKGVKFTTDESFNQHWVKIYISKMDSSHILFFRPFEIIVSNINTRELHTEIISKLSKIKIDNIEYEPSTIKDNFTATFEIGDDCPLYVNDSEFKRYKKALENLDDALYVSSNLNCLLINDDKLIKHPDVNVWYTKDEETKIRVLEQLKKYQDIFTVHKPSNIVLFNEFCESFNFKLSDVQPLDSLYITLISNDYLNGEWFINCEYYQNLLLNKQFPNMLPIVTLSLSYLNTTSDKVYGAFMFAYIKTLQNTPMALFEIYNDVIIDYNYNTKCYELYFYVDSYETIVKIKSVILNPENYTVNTFFNFFDILNYRLNLSEQGIRSVLSPDKLSVISDGNITNIKNINESRDVLNIINNNHLVYNGYSSYNQVLLGIVNDTNLTWPVTPLYGNIQFSYNNLEASYFVVNNNGQSRNEITTVMKKSSDAEFYNNILNTAWNKGIFLSIWAACYTFRTGKPSHSSDLISLNYKTEEDWINFIKLIQNY
jgi:hypothetical protein